MTGVTLKAGVPVYTQDSACVTNGFILEVTKEHITVVSDWGNIMQFTHKTFEEVYTTPDDFMEDFPWPTPIERLQEQIDKLTKVLKTLK